MSLLKLKFKIELLAKLYKYPSTLLSVDEFTLAKTQQDYKSKPKLNQSKYSMRNSKTFTGEFDILPGFDQLTSKMGIDEKEELYTYLKTLDSNHLYQICVLLSNRHLYNKLKTKTGLELIRSTFKEIILKYKKEDLSSEPLIELNDECELFICLRDILSLTELDSMELFSLFKYNEFFCFNEVHFTMLIYLYLAYECKTMEDYWKSFGEDMFKAISGGEKIITVTRMKELACLLGFNEKMLSLIINEMSFDLYTEIDIGKFKDFYLKLSRKYDNTYTNNIMQTNSNVNNNSNSGKSALISQINNGQAQFHSRDKLSCSGSISNNTSSTANKFRIGKK